MKKKIESDSDIEAISLCKSIIDLRTKGIEIDAIINISLIDLALSEFKDVKQFENEINNIKSRNNKNKVGIDTIDITFKNETYRISMADVDRIDIDDYSININKYESSQVTIKFR